MIEAGTGQIWFSTMEALSTPNSSGKDAQISRLCASSAKIDPNSCIRDPIRGWLTNGFEYQSSVDILEY
jgi:hypothetical protein